MRYFVIIALVILCWSCRVDDGISEFSVTDIHSNIYLSVDTTGANTVYVTAGVAAEIETFDGFNYQSEPQGNVSILMYSNGSIQLSTSSDFDLGKQNGFSDMRMYLSNQNYGISEGLEIELGNTTSGVLTINMISVDPEFSIYDYQYIVIYDANDQIVVASGKFSEI